MGLGVVHDVDLLFLELHIVRDDGLFLCPPTGPLLALVQGIVSLHPPQRRMVPYPPNGPLDSKYSCRVCVGPVYGTPLEFHFWLPYFLCADRLGLRDNFSGSLPLDIGLAVGRAPLVVRKLLLVLELVQVLPGCRHHGLVGEGLAVVVVRFLVLDGPLWLAPTFGLALQLVPVLSCACVL